MIETTYVGLQQASVLLQTEANSLLLLAAEGRIPLFAMVNRRGPAPVRVNFAFAEDVDATDAEPVADNASTPEETYYLYSMILPHEAAILAAGGSYSTSFFIPDLDAAPIPATHPARKLAPSGPASINASLAYIRRDDLNHLLQKNRAATSLPSEESSASGATRARNTLLAIIAGMADQLHLDLAERGTASKIQEWTQHVGAGISAETIKKYLDMIPSLVDQRSTKA